MKMLNKVTSGVSRLPLSVVIHGTPGVGKTSFGKNADRPIYLDFEGGSKHLNVNRIGISSWDEAMSTLNEIVNDTHNFQTLILDPLDSLEPMLHDKIKLESGGKSIEHAYGGYGKGYVVAAERFMELRDLVDKARAKGMDTILSIHSDPKEVPDAVSGINFLQWQPRLHKKSAPVFLDWTDNILFANWENFRAENSQGKEVVIGEGKRIIYTEERPAFRAKNRFNLPPEIPFNKETGWLDFKSLIDKYYLENDSAHLEIARKTVLEKINKISDPELKSRVEATFVIGKNDPQKLREMDSRLTEILKA